MCSETVRSANVSGSKKYGLIRNTMLHTAVVSSGVDVVPNDEKRERQFCNRYRTHTVSAMETHLMSCLCFAVVSVCCANIRAVCNISMCSTFARMHFIRPAPPGCRLFQIIIANLYLYSLFSRHCKQCTYQIVQNVKFARPASPPRVLRSYLQLQWLCSMPHCSDQCNHTL